jgi:hypothetical protein
MTIAKNVFHEGQKWRFWCVQKIQIIDWELEGFQDQSIMHRSWKRVHVQRIHLVLWMKWDYTTIYNYEHSSRK